jgi:hypothetical protein
MQVSRCVAGIDVHKKMLAVVVGRTHGQGLQLERAKFGTTTKDLELVSTWLQTHGVEEVVMESTGQYHKPVWLQLGGAISIALGTVPFESRTEGPEGRLRRCSANDQAFPVGRPAEKL